MSHTPERRANISEALKGRTFSEAHRANLSRAAKAAWARRRVRWLAVCYNGKSEKVTLAELPYEAAAISWRAGFHAAFDLLRLTRIVVDLKVVQGDGEA